MSILPPELIVRIDKSHADLRERLKRIRSEASITLKIVEIYENLFADAESDVQAMAGIDYLRDQLLNGSSVADALENVSLLSEPAGDVPSQADELGGLADTLETFRTTLADLSRKVDDLKADNTQAFKIIKRNVEDLSLRFADFESFLHTHFGFTPTRSDAPEPQEPNDAPVKEKREADQPTQSGFDFLTSQDYVGQQPATSLQGGGAGSHSTNETVVGVPLDEREHIVGLKLSLDHLAKTLKRPVHSKELRAEMDARNINYGDMSPTWMSSTLGQTCIRWGEPGKGGWWPTNLLLNPIGDDLFQQATAPKNKSARAAAQAVFDAYSARRASRNLPPLRIVEPKRS